MFLIPPYFLLHFILIHYRYPVEMKASSEACQGHCVRICGCGLAVQQQTHQRT